MTQEKVYKPLSGWFALLICIALFIAVPTMILSFIASLPTAVPSAWLFLLPPLMFFTAVIMIFGFQAIAPNNARAYLLFGKYKGSVTTSGFYWVNPFYSKKRISLRIRNFETGTTSTPAIKEPVTGKVITPKQISASKPSKVNDKDGNPIEISAVVVWKVVNTAEALFDVDDYQNFVEVQSEAALRSLASRHPYDGADDEVSLRGSTDEVCEQLAKDIQERLKQAGVKVIEARISHLAYAPEIAAAMLQRQQAAAVVAARTKIVEGAVGMVKMALDQLARDNIVELDDERRATMVSNLLVVLCSDKHIQPVINTGSLYN